MGKGSREIKEGWARAPHRSLLRACRMIREEDDIHKTFIGIANSFSEIVPGHVHLNKVARVVKDAVRLAGGIPFEFNTIAVCDGIAMNHIGMKYSLASREVIADSLEIMVRAHCFDGLICIPNCDKTVPGMLMAAVRLNIPTIFVSGGPMRAGKGGTDLITVFEKIAEIDKADQSKSDKDRLDKDRLLEELRELERNACPGPGSCSGMFTANSMNCLCEAIGMALPGNGTILAEDPRRKDLYKKAGRQIMALVKKQIKPLDIITIESMDNALALDMAMGGSTNTVLHTLAIASEAGIPYDLDRINAISAKCPNICKVSPARTPDGTRYHVEDVDAAGGVSAILNEIKGLLNLDCPTVTGKTLGENIAEAKIENPEVIHPLGNAYSKTGGLAILRGNLAPNGAVVKTAGVKKESEQHTGPAVVFESEEDVFAAMRSGQFNEVEGKCVVVIRYEGPKGGPGMREMLSPTAYIEGAELGKMIALITDGRFSGGTTGLCIGHISPEAAAHGPIGLLKDGDVIEIDIPKKTINVKLSPDELEKREKACTPPPPRIKEGYLVRYASMVQGAEDGAVLRVTKE